MMLGASVPVFAELDLSGMWANRLNEDFLSRAPGPRIGDCMGLPINDEGRARADARQISIQTMPERQCILYTSQYIVMGPQSFKMLSDIDPISGRVIAWHITATVDRAPHTIWMDGGPDGLLYVVTGENPGALLRIERGDAGAPAPAR